MNAIDMNRFSRYGTAVAAAIGAFLMTVAFRRVGNPGSFCLFIAAVLFSAWYGGFGPGVLAMIVSGIAGAGVLVLRPGGADVGMRLSLFVMVSAMAIVVGTLARQVPQAEVAPAASAGAANGKARPLAIIADELGILFGPLIRVVQMFTMPLSHPLAHGEVREVAHLEGKDGSAFVHKRSLSTGHEERRYFGKARVNLHESLLNAAQACEVELTDKQIELTVHFAASHAHVVEDAAGLEELFRDLVRSVIQFVPRGGSIDVRTSNTSDAQVVVEISARNAAGESALHAAVLRSPYADQQAESSPHLNEATARSTL